jgi:CheY-like chemotaxis protein
MGVVLVVEDDPLNASLAQAVLSRDGHRVLMAADGPTALDMACRWQPDLVLLDVSLLGPMTGLDVCRALRADPATATIAVLMLSGWAFTSDIEAASAAGADAYIAKPFSNADLRARVHELIDHATSRARSRSDATGEAPQGC